MDDVEGAEVEFERSLLRTGLVIPGPALCILTVAARCDWGTYWQVDGKARVLTASTHWSRGTARTERLQRETVSKSLTLSEGTAGHVWRSGKPVWTSNLAMDMCLPRSLHAGDAGLHGGIWFAIKTAEVIYGVVEVLGPQVPPASPSDLVRIELFGMRLGVLMSQRGESQDGGDRRA